MLRWLVFLLLAGTACVANAARPPLVIPTDPDTVLEKLPRGYSLLGGKSAPRSAQERIDRLLATAARTGDARLVARADRLLASLPANNVSPQILKARAYSAQYRHDFQAAGKTLDELVTRYPRDGGARLARAQLHLVTGRLDLSKADCVALLMGIDAGRAQICIAAIALRRGDTVTAIHLADQWLARTSRDDALGRHVLALRAEASARAGAADAEGWFRRLLALEPDDVRSLVSYARYLRSVGRDRDVLPLLAKARDNDAMQLQAALAAHAARLPEARAMASAMGRRYRLARTLGAVPELRDEAEFLLSLQGDSAGALALAQRNFATQRDHEDVDLLRRAAEAAHMPAALAPVRVWARSQQVMVPQLSGSPG